MGQVQKVAILETVDKEGNIPYAHKLMLRSNLAKAITNAPGFEAYDRTDMDAIMGEQNFQRTGMVSDDQIKRLGQMTGAAFILVAEAVKVDDQNMFITAKILNVETAKTEMTDNTLMGVSANDIQHGCESLANKLLGINAATVNPSPAQKQNARVQQTAVQQYSAPQPKPTLTTIKGIGELKAFSDGSYGIVFYKTQDGHGLVVSLDESSQKWENVSRARDCHDVLGLPNEEGLKFMTFKQGIQNTATILQQLGAAQAPAANWCLQHGSDWYLPSDGELWYLLTQANASQAASGPISQALTKAGGTPLSNSWHWSSTENDKDEAINVSTSGWVSSEDKNNTATVRAVRAF